MVYDGNRMEISPLAALGRNDRWAGSKGRVGTGERADRDWEEERVGIGRKSKKNRVKCVISPDFDVLCLILQGLEFAWSEYLAVL